MSEMLPGMEEYQVDKPGETDLTTKSFTAAVVQKRYPGVFRSIIYGLQQGLPNSIISGMLHVSPQTVAEVKKHGAALFLSQRKRAIRGTVSNRLLESIERQTADEQLLDAMPLRDRVAILKALEDIDLGSDDSSTLKKPAEEIIDVESVSAFEDSVNGFNGAEDSAHGDDGRSVAGDGPEIGAEGSTGNGNADICSVERSEGVHGDPIDTGEKSTLCKSLCNSLDGSGSENPDAAAREVGAPAVRDLIGEHKQRKVPGGAGAPPRLGRGCNPK